MRLCFLRLVDKFSTSRYYLIYYSYLIPPHLALNLISKIQKVLGRASGGLSGLAIYPVSHIFAGFKEGQGLFLNLNFLATLWISPGIGFVIPHDKASEPTNFDPLLALHGNNHGIEGGVHQGLCLFRVESHSHGKFFNQFRFVHVSPPTFV